MAVPSNEASLQRRFEKQLTKAEREGYVRHKCALILSDLNLHLCWRSTAKGQWRWDWGPGLCKEVLRSSSSLGGRAEQRAKYQCAPAMTEMNDMSDMDTCSPSKALGTTDRLQPR